MKTEIVGSNKNIAKISGDDVIISNAASALDLIASVSYETKCRSIIIDKANITEDFFKLSTGLAGEILQKFVNYNIRLAIVGDFSRYSSEPLKDFIYESNKGKHIFFTANEEDAINKLSV